MGPARSLSQPLPPYILSANLDPEGHVQISVGADPLSYYTLLRGDIVNEINDPVAMVLGVGGTVTMRDPAPASARTRSFFRVLATPTASPGDADGDGISDLFELHYRPPLDPLDPSDAFLDPDGDGLNNLEEFHRGSDPRSAVSLLTRILSTSPRDGDALVAVSRETVLRFDRPLALGVLVGPGQYYAQANGRRLLTRVEIGSDRRSATLFYLEPMPGSSRVTVSFDASEVRDQDGRKVDADGDGQEGGKFQLSFETLSLTPVANTFVCGRVFSSVLVPGRNGESINEPLPGVTITVDGREEQIRAVTDQFGDFRLGPVPAGPFFVHIDGRTVIDEPRGVRYPDLAYYPNVGKRWEALPQREMNLSNIFLPLIPAGTLKPVNLQESTVLAFSPDFVRSNPQFEGVSLTIPAGSLFSENGTRGGRVGIAPVPPDRLPGPLPEGLPIQDVITIQTDGGANFDQPVSACFPNLPDPKTGQKLAPGAKSALWSFNHDTGRFEIVGSATVSADGRLVCTDPGVGIVAPGWHGTAPGSVARGGRLVQGKPGETDSPEESPNPQPDDATDPVYLFSGEFHDSREDLSIPGRGLNFTWIRKYRSKLGGVTEQGNGWDFSYNVSLKASGQDLVLYNGQSRADSYKRQTDGSYSRPGFFRELVINADQTLTLTFEDRTEWGFYALADLPRGGKLATIKDRYGNTMRLFYDEFGRLDRIRDTLDRDILVGYNSDGYIASLTDFSGRVVKYQYYDGRTPGGNPGDLKSVTSPAVTGTPNRNDFPQGKTTTYTYSSGFADDRLNHNLLTVTDGRRNNPADPTYASGPYLVNVYSSVTDPSDPNFDRVVRQVLGGDVIDMTYIQLLASFQNGNAANKAIVNDRNGNVKEYFYDTKNRMIKTREYTGFADPRQPTTETSNRPVGKFRPEDPDFFETSYEWTEDSLPRRTVHPNGNTTEFVYESDLNPGVPVRSRGNLRIRRQLTGSYAPAGDHPVLEERFEYDPRFAGSEFVIRHTNARGHTTEHTYDAKGNRTQTRHALPGVVEDWEFNEFGQMTAYVAPDNGSNYRRRDTYVYYDSGPQRGYLERVHVDASRENLVTRFEYDRVGNVVRSVDPKGLDTQYIYNALDQEVRNISPEVSPGSGIRYLTDFHYDANNNLIRTDKLNLDEKGVVRANTNITITYEYEILNLPIRIRHEVAEGQWMTQEYAYDANRNRTLVRHGESVAGRQPANAVRVQYDERNLLYRTIAGLGDAGQATTQHDYDRNGNLITIRQGLEDTPRILRMTYDGQNRVIAITDPGGNQVRTAYDAVGNKVRAWVEGELQDSFGTTNNVRLSDARFVYDQLNRLASTESDLFNPATQLPVGPGRGEGRMFYNAASQVTRMVDANGNERNFIYDTVGRLSRTIDTIGNSTEQEYDRNSNVSRVTESEVVPSSPPDVFVTAFEYDGLDREIRSIDSAGNVSDSAYDSRDNLVVESDESRSSTNAPGNISTFEYDAADRLLRATYFQTDSGQGGGTRTGSHTVTQTWDDSNRLLTQTDPQGNTTRYIHDPLNREVSTIFADGTGQTNQFDVHHNVVRIQDANGNVVTNQYDLLNRLVSRSVLPGPTVHAGTRLETYRYDGLSRLVSASDEDSLVTRAYDSLSHLIEEVQNGQKIQFSFDAVGNMAACTYPGGRVITNSFDRLNRKVAIGDQQGRLAAMTYAGPSRLLRTEYRNGTINELSYDGMQNRPRAPNDFGVKKAVRTVHSKKVGGVAFGDLSYRWDRKGNKIERNDSQTGGISRQFSYDSLYRLTRSIETGPQSLRQTNSYKLDLAGNRVAVAGNTNAGSYTLDSTGSSGADASLNQYTRTPFDARRYDPNGNLVRIDLNATARRELTYDYRNQLTTHSNSVTGVTVAYQYDALGRRIRESYLGTNTPATLFLHAGDRVCEEHDDSHVTKATYVHGNYLDEVLTMSRGGNDYFYHCDDQYNVTTLTDSAGQVLERYDYEDFGMVHIADAGGAPKARSQAGNPYFFTGQRLDAATGFYFYRSRYYDSRAGRFLTRDTIGIWGDPGNLGNGFAYVGNNPASQLDPMGLGFLSLIFEGKWDGESRDSEYLGIFEKTTKGAVTIAADTFTFGKIDALHQEAARLEATHGEFAYTRALATVSREMFSNVLMAGLGAARGGACALQGMGKLTPLIQAIQQSPNARLLADLAYRAIQAINAGQDAYDLFKQIHKLSQGNGSVMQALMDLISLVGNIKDLRSRPDFCLAEGTLVLTASGLIPIEQIQVGQRVLTDDPLEDLYPTQVDPETWRVIELQAPDPRMPGEFIKWKLLRPLSWIENWNCVPGTEIPIRIPDLSVMTLAAVVRITPCPEIQQGSGHVVLATMESNPASLWCIAFQDSQSSLILTPQHLLFSQTRGDWIPASLIAIGDNLRAGYGHAVVTRSSPSERVDLQCQSVYNLQIEQARTFFVSEHGILTHNAYSRPKPTDFSHELAVSSNTARSHLRKAMNGGSGQAHHVVPWQLKDHDLVQKAARGGFNINGANNGILLGPLQHKGSHPTYTRAIESKLNSILRSNPKISDRAAADKIQAYVDTLKERLENVNPKKLH